VPPDRDATAEAAKRAVATVFGINGFLFASWMSRLPAVRDQLHLTPGGLGLLLLCVSIGSVSTLPLSGVAIHRLGRRRATLGASSLMAGSLAVAGSVPATGVLAVALVLVGVGTAIWDVAANVEGADVEQRLGRPLMPRLHAGFSLGTVLGAALGAGAAALQVPVELHVPVASLAGMAAAARAVRRFVPEPAVPEPEVTPSATGVPVAAPKRSSGSLDAWREPRTLVIGLLVLGMAFAEGSANDWLTVALVDGYGIDHALAALGLGLFVTAMTAARTAGSWVLARYGRVRAVRGGALLVAAGVAAVVAGPLLQRVAGDAAALALAALGALAWGAGAALGFPVGMSAAADDPRHAAARVSVASTIGYVAFLGGPPVLGLLGDRFGIVRALAAVEGAVLVSLLAAGALRPPGTRHPDGER